jgi:hypothetical protein
MRQAMKKPRRKHRAIYQDTKGRWRIDCDVNGKHVRRFAGMRKTHADRLLRQIRSTIDDGAVLSEK